MAFLMGLPAQAGARQLTTNSPMAPQGGIGQALGNGGTFLQLLQMMAQQGQGGMQGQIGLPGGMPAQAGPQGSIQGYLGPQGQIGKMQQDRVGMMQQGQGGMPFGGGGMRPGQGQQFSGGPFGNILQKIQQMRGDSGGDPMQAILESRYGAMGTPFPFGRGAQGRAVGQYGLSPSFVQLANALRARRLGMGQPQGGSQPR